MNPAKETKSLRDEFAMAALTGLTSYATAWVYAKTQVESGRAKDIGQIFALQAYDLADAMLAERKK